MNRTLGIRLQRGNRIGESSPLSVKNVGAGHGLAVGRQPGPLNKRSALDRKTAEPSRSAGEWLRGLREKARGVLGQVEVVVRGNFDVIRLFRHA